MSKSFPRVLQVLPALESGGVEKATYDWVKILRQDHPMVPTFVASAGGRFVKPLEEWGCIHLTLPLTSKNPGRILWHAKRLADFIHQNGIQLVHARSRAPAWSALLATQWLKIPFLTTYHGVYNSHNRLKRFYNSVMARGDRVIAISAFVANHIEQEHSTLHPNICTIPEGIDVDLFHPERVSADQVRQLRHEWGAPPDRAVILLPGRLTRWKGQEVLAKAIPLLPNKKIFVVFLGDDQGRTDYKKRVVELTQGMPAAFIANCPYMPAAYAAADVVLSCSIEPEAFGRITAEALSMGRPYIGTPLGATPELCLDEKTGFLVPPGDYAALAQKIDTVLSLPLERKALLAQTARDHIVHNFSLARMATLTQQVYEETAYYSK